ncbi:alpha/beta hydrolase [Bacillus pinisoli]|uniref:alpha/beta hydrolase n=1 Tax=Bacillus pinisoli TaxID=2901866 RepID=UPI001FF6BED4|nr:alpha/beta hydrolase [Bacillus pinisoli]
MNQQFFLLDEEWSVVHLPERPNGFAIFIIGDRHHFVDSNSSFWIQNAGRYTFIEQFVRSGYTVFYSNLYGRHWGSPKATNLAKRLYHVVMKREILNEHVHLLLEGMGALSGLELMDQMGENIRSVAMLNPCLSLKEQLKHEQENKLFYKRMIKEVVEAYQWEEHIIEDGLAQLPDLKSHQSTIPVKIWISTDEQTYQSKKIARMFEESRKEYSPIQLTLHLNEKRFGIGSSILQFFSKNEKTL